MMKRVYLTVSILCLQWTQFHAAPMAVRDLLELTREADTIVLGRIVAARDIGPGGSGERERIVETDVEVDETIKGTSAAAVKYRFRSATVGLESLDSMLRQERVFFLRRSGTYLEAANEYYPSIVGIRSVVRGTTEPLDRVIEIVGGVIQAPTVPTATRVEAIYTLWRIKRATVAVPLRRAVNERNLDVRLAAAAALLSIDDLGGWPAAEGVLLARSPVVPNDSDSMHNLIVAITESVKSKQSIPFLARLLRSDDARVRRAATSALGHAHAAESIAPLVQALDDRDQETRLNSIRAFAEIAGKHDQSPSDEAFRRDPERYVAFWKDWAARRQ
ncbi:MAG: hypothetical protein DMF98_08655 [Acidobacteria bacterium]|nr:MAG: hypothetical protein DMF98_08655 [Acidobacteriota bacterium]